jgi:hypothetical protein
MVELEHEWITFAAIDAWVGAEVVRDQCPSLLPTALLGLV